MSFHVPESCRIRSGRLASTVLNGNNGAFDLGRGMAVIATDSGGWEHVSVSFPNRTPSWDEMAQVKKIFWDDEDCVVQFHPRKSQFRQIHPHCLHLWRCTYADFPEPNPDMVAPA